MIDLDNITFCANTDCKNKKCERHPSLLEKLPKGTMVSMADFGGTCRDYIFQILEEAKDENHT